MGLRATATGRGRSSMSKVLALVCCASLCFISISAPVSSNAGRGRAPTDVRSWRRKSTYEVDITQRRSLVGPGSYPPQCTKKCGKCTPCRPVHVPIPPRAPAIVDSEYYPEAWRCKCGNRLYMP